MWEMIGIIAIFILGLLLFIKPKLTWKIKHLFDVKNVEPTYGYLIFSRCLVIFGIIVGIVLFIVYIVK